LNVAGTVIEGEPGAVLKRGAIAGRLSVTADRCVIRDLEFDGNNAVFSHPTYSRNANIFVTSSYNRLMGLRSHNSNSHGIGLDGQATTCYYNEVSGCLTHDNNEVGIATNSVKYSKVIFNTSLSNDYEGLTVDIASQFNIISHNLVRGNCTAGGVGGIGVDDADYNIIAMNVVADTAALSGITTQNNIAGCESNVIAGNVLSANGAYGIQLKNTSSHYSSKNTLTGNVLKSNTSGSIYVASGCTGNILSSNSLDGVAATDLGSTTTHIPTP
jgi:parallel beta-helix repeat protein